MNRNAVGWLFVAVQAVLLCALIFLPGSDHWGTPGWLSLLGMAIIVVGFAIIAMASLKLGSSLTPTPVPNGRGALTTSGLYRYARHPIYSGVLAIVIGLTLRSGSVQHLAIGLASIGFFNVKAKWEEDRLAEHFPGYIEYASRTPRFVPRPWR